MKTNKFNQKGSMMIEAMAMLALIALVTPTLYKKSAERTTELQDINAANSARTLMKAVDNYVAVHYDELVKDFQKEGAEPVIKIDNDAIKNFLPYGYDSEHAMKNMGTPAITVTKKGEDEENISLTSFVTYPAQGNKIDSVRASRIASMIGANGGYVNKEGETQGIGGVWGLNGTETKQIAQIEEEGSVPQNSIVTMSAESINNANRGTFENSKYLQRVREGNNDSDLWRNTMTTDLYMGGTQKYGGGDEDLHGIYGVSQMIIGEKEDTTHSLVVKGNDDKDGSAYIEGTLEALDGLFSATEDGLVFSNENGDLLSVAENETSIGVNGVGEDSPYKKILTVNKDGIMVNGDVSAEGDGKFKGDLKVGGTDGQTISADEENVKLYEDKFVLDASDKSLAIDLEKTKIAGTVAIAPAGEIDDLTGTQQMSFGVDKNVLLEVKGNVYVKDNLEADKIGTNQFLTKELHAGTENLASLSEGSPEAWLNATGNGVSIVQPKKSINGQDVQGRVERLTINSSDGLVYNDVLGKERFKIDDQKVVISDTLKGDEEDTVSLAIGHEDDNAYISMKDRQNKERFRFDDKALVLKDEAGNKRLSISSSTGPSYGTYLYGPQWWSSDGEFKGQGEIYMGDNDINIEGVEKVSIQTGTEGTVSLQKGAVNVDGNWIDQEKPLLLVDTEGYEGSEENQDRSVYIRRGAIEIEGSKEISDSTKRFGLVGDKDKVIGNVVASRFVANNMDINGNVIEPEYKTYAPSTSKYDRYMVNPAYTSVMHDIKLTTRGGARLSDILPDFINKGIYILSNSYPEETSINSYRITTGEGNSDAFHLIKDGTGTTWASPIMGAVPKPLCPKGYAMLMTLSPSGFQIGQAGNIQRDSSGRYFINEYQNLENAASKIKGEVKNSGDELDVAKPHEYQVYKSAIGNDDKYLYYIGWQPEQKQDEGYLTGQPTPLYFQPSTWLKSVTIPSTTTGIWDSEKGDGINNFVGWTAAMGFIYPKAKYSKVIDNLLGDSSNPDSDDIKLNDTDAYYWNVLPVAQNSLNAWATVYCYFDRGEIGDHVIGDSEGWGDNNKLVDDYDQLNNFRSNNEKNPDYEKRLEDPHLKYNDPW